MTTGDVKFLCSKCKVSVHVGVDASSRIVVCCPVCGESDTLENALLQARQHFLQSSLGHLARFEEPASTTAA
jgi:hypothetical protein